MTFLEFKQQLKAEVIPDKDSSRLDQRHDGWIVNALIEIQQKVKCLQANHKEYVTQAATYYSCGASAFAIPNGAYVKSLRVQETANNCNYVDAVPYAEAMFRGVLQRMQKCRCTPPTGEDDTYLQYYGYEYDYGESDPELRPATSEIDLTTRPLNRAYSIFEGNIWVWPVISSTDTAILKWNGVKKNWRNTDIMPWVDEEGVVDREVIEIVSYYFWAKRYQFDACDIEKANNSYALYRKKLGEMMIECRRKAALPEYNQVFTDCASC